MEGIDLRIEEARQTFMTLYKKQRLFNNLALIVVVTLIIAAYVVLQVIMNLNYAALGAVAGVLGLLFVYSRISRSKMEGATKQYIFQYYELMKEKAFPKERFPDATMDFEKKLDLKIFIDAGILKNIVRINSRGNIALQRKDQTLQLSDLAAYTAGDGKQTPSFLGKFLMVPACLDFSGRILIYVKPKIAGNGPNDLDDVKKIEETDRWAIYASEPSLKRFLSPQFFRHLELLEIDDHLIDVVISIKPTDIKVCLSYTDALMVIPLQNPFVPGPSDHFVQDLQTVFSLIDTLK